MTRDGAWFEAAAGDQILSIGVIQRAWIVTPNDGQHVKETYPGWQIIDSDDGMSVEGGTSYLLERWVDRPCYVCGGRGRRSSFVLAAGGEVEGECPDCEGTGRHLGGDATA